MSKLQFHYKQKNRKTWLMPLIVIMLLYISIPFLLIQSGDESIKEAILQTEKTEVELPSKEYTKAVAFLKIAEAFPGFTNWAKQIRQNANEKMLNIYLLKCTKKSTGLFIQISEYSSEYDSLSVSFEHLEDSILLNATIISKEEKKNIKTLLPIELRNELKTKFCDVWERFFQKNEIDIIKNNSICNL